MSNIMSPAKDSAIIARKQQKSKKSFIATSTLLKIADELIFRPTQLSSGASVDAISV